MVEAVTRLRGASSRAALFAVAAVALTLAHAAYFARAGMRALLVALPDDAFYYQQIAWNIAHRRGISFDGLTPTNGFQPLWLASLVPVHLLVPNDREQAFRASMLLATALMALGSVLVYQTFKRAFGDTWITLSASLAMALLFFRAGTNGMETGLSLLASLGALCLVLSARIDDPSERPTRGALFGLGALLGLAVLSRLDHVFLAIAAVAALAWPMREPARRAAALRSCLWVGAGVTLLVAPYLVANKLCFGALMPISGQIKDSFPHARLALLPARIAGLAPIAACQVLVAAAWLGWLLVGRPELSALPWEKRALTGAATVSASAVVLHFAHEMLFMKWAIMSWHFAMGYPTLVIVPMAFWASASAGDRLGRASSALGVSAILAVGAFYLQSTGMRLAGNRGEVWHVVCYDAALWARDNLPPSAVLAMKDAGITGYFSDRPTINLDGVVNDRAYQDTLRDGRLGPYLQSKGVTHLVQHAVLKDDPYLPWVAGGRGDVRSGDYDWVSLRYDSHLYETLSDAITLRRRDEVYRSPPYETSGTTTSLLIWRFAQGGPIASESARE